MQAPQADVMQAQQESQLEEQLEEIMNRMDNNRCFTCNSPVPSLAGEGNRNDCQCLRCAICLDLLSDIPTQTLACGHVSCLAPAYILNSVS